MHRKQLICQCYDILKQKLKDEKYVFTYKRHFFVSGYLLFKEFCEQTSEEPVPQLKFYEEVNITHFYTKFMYTKILKW